MRVDLQDQQAQHKPAFPTTSRRRRVVATNMKLYSNPWSRGIAVEWVGAVVSV